MREIALKRGLDFDNPAALTDEDYYRLTDIQTNISILLLLLLKITFEPQVADHTVNVWVCY